MTMITKVTVMNTMIMKIFYSPQVVENKNQTKETDNLKEQ